MRMIEDERALDILLSEPAQGGVHEKGISAGGLWHVAADLGAYIGQRVRIRLDEGDAGKISVFSEDGVFLCEAVCPERAGISRRQLAQATRKVQGEMLRKAKKVASRLSPRPPARAPSLGRYWREWNRKPPPKLPADRRRHGPLRLRRRCAQPTRTKCRDEADLVARQRVLAEMVRELGDLTGHPIVLVGSTGLASRLDMHLGFSRRIWELVEFRPATIRDVGNLARSLWQIPDSRRSGRMATQSERRAHLRTPALSPPDRELCAGQAGREPDSSGGHGGAGTGAGQVSQTDPRAQPAA